MRSRIVIGALAATALAFQAPAAQADEPEFDCAFDSVQQPDVTGANYEGAAYGYVVHPQGAGVSIRCVVLVNGVEATSTPVASGRVGAVSAGRISFEAGPEDAVDLCPEITWHESPEPRLVCWSVPPQLPPQEVIDAFGDVLDIVNPVITDVVEPVVCGTLAALHASGAGVPGVVELNDQGDVFLLGEPFWDCPPYDLFPPA